MRLLKLILLTGLIPFVPPLRAATPPIPQDPILMKQRSAAWLSWNRQTLGDAYKKVGKHSPKWDKPAEQALELAARLFSLQTDPFTQAPEVYQAARQAVDAGCADPLVLYLYAQTSLPPNYPGDEEFVRRVNRAVDALMASDYSPFRQATGLLRSTEMKLTLAGQKPTPSQLQAIETGLNGVIDLLAQSVKADPRGEFWEARWYENLKRVLSAYRQLSPDLKTAFARFEPKLARVAGVDALRLALKGEYLVGWAWEGRSNAFAPKVTEQQFRTFHDRLTEARAALEAAYKLNPHQPYVARNMLGVELGDGGDRAPIELWFGRALEVDPYDHDACMAKLKWLDPKWHGDPAGQNMLDFGQACASTHNWPTGITLILADAMINYTANIPGTEQKKFFRKSENWNAIAIVFEEYLKHYPDDYGALSKYAFLAYMSGQVEVAHRVFQGLGDNLTTWPEKSSPPISSLRQARDIVAQAAGSLPKPATKPK